MAPTTRQPLAIVISDPSHNRVHGALTLAAASAAIGQSVSLFFHGEAVTVLEEHRIWPADATLRSNGIPTVPELLHTALELGVNMMACTSGLHLCGMTAAVLPAGVEPGGMMAFLADAQKDGASITLG